MKKQVFRVKKQVFRVALSYDDKRWTAVTAGALRACIVNQGLSLQAPAVTTVVFEITGPAFKVKDRVRHSFGDGKILGTVTKIRKGAQCPYHVDWDSGVSSNNSGDMLILIKPDKLKAGDVAAVSAVN